MEHQLPQNEIKELQQAHPAPQAEPTAEPSGEPRQGGAKQRRNLLIFAGMALAVAAVWFLKNPPAAAPQAEPAQAAQSEAEADGLQLAVLDLETLAAQALPMLLDFGSETCGPCLAMHPALESVHRQAQGKATVHYFDVDKLERLEFPIRVTPTQALFLADGSPYVPSEAILGAGYRFSMYSHKDTGEHALTLHEGMLSEQQLLELLRDMGAGV